MHLECYVLANPEKEQGIVDDPLFTHKKIVAEISAEKISLINITCLNFDINMSIVRGQTCIILDE